MAYFSSIKINFYFCFCRSFNLPQTDTHTHTIQSLNETIWRKKKRIQVSWFYHHQQHHHFTFIFFFFLHGETIIFYTLTISFLLLYPSTLHCRTMGRQFNHLISLSYRAKTVHTATCGTAISQVQIKKKNKNDEFNHT